MKGHAGQKHCLVLAGFQLHLRRLDFTFLSSPSLSHQFDLTAETIELDPMNFDFTFGIESGLHHQAPITTRMMYFYIDPCRTRCMHRCYLNSAVCSTTRMNINCEVLVRAIVQPIWRTFVQESDAAIQAAFAVVGWVHLLQGN
jgi:hypothetical protein